MNIAHGPCAASALLLGETLGLFVALRAVTKGIELHVMLI